MRKFLCKWLKWHQYIEYTENAGYSYQMCIHCHGRRCVQMWETRDDSQKPPDQDWIDGKKPLPGVDVSVVMTKFIDSLVIGLGYDEYDIMELGETGHPTHREIMVNYQNVQGDMSPLERKTAAMSKFVSDKAMVMLKEIVGEENIEW